MDFWQKFAVFWSIIALLLIFGPAVILAILHFLAWRAKRDVWAGWQRESARRRKERKQ